MDNSHARWWTAMSAVCVCVWGGASYYGKATLCVFDGPLDDKFYVDTILKRHALPFMRTHREVQVLQQVGDPKHTSAAARRLLDRELGDQGWTYPPPRSWSSWTKEKGGQTLQRRQSAALRCGFKKGVCVMSHQHTSTQRNLLTWLLQNNFGHGCRG
eukprot:c20781_g1_i1.p1 GENE.c20781_g1_i1~~c20781_g1_i1.p1  ORF type:complete len:157 (+),score=18.92 c20781_g1_i1:626-1096(+)